MNDAEVIKKYAALVNYIAQSRTVQLSDAEDVCQDVFLKYVDKHPNFKSEEHAKAWFIRVTINTAASLYRRHDYKKRNDFEEETVELKQIKDGSDRDEWTAQIESDAAFEANLNFCIIFQHIESQCVEIVALGELRGCVIYTVGIGA